jgi:multicomponent Na+:H+ antiporter subunit F
MNALLAGAAAFLLLNIFSGMIRLVRGPTAADRMLAIQLFGTSGIAMLVLLSALYQEPTLINIALGFCSPGKHDNSNVCKARGPGTSKP